MSLLILWAQAGLSHAATPQSDDDKQAEKSARDLLPFGVFGSLEFSTNATGGLSEWQAVTARIDGERALYARCDQGRAGCPENLRQWRMYLKRWASLDELSKLEDVNAYVNGRIRYADDQIVYGREDYWASPAQSLGNRGDCEDYAIAKYESLKALGFAEHDLRLVILKDTRRALGHAVLSVRTASGLYILDNQRARPFLHDTVAYYMPVFSVNREGRWINIATRKIRAEYEIAAASHGDPALKKPLKKAVQVATVGTSDAAIGASDTDAEAPALAPPASPLATFAGPEPAQAKKSAQPWLGWTRELP